MSISRRAYSLFQSTARSSNNPAGILFHGRTDKSFDPRELLEGFQSNPFKSEFTAAEIKAHVYPESRSPGDPSYRLISMTTAEHIASWYAHSGGWGDPEDLSSKKRGTICYIHGTHINQYKVDRFLRPDERVNKEQEIVTHFVPSFFIPYFLIDNVEVINPFAINMNNPGQVKDALKLVQQFEQIKMNSKDLPESVLKKNFAEYSNNLKTFYEKYFPANPFKRTFGKVSNTLWTDQSILGEQVGDYYSNFGIKKILEELETSSKASIKFSK